MLLSSVDSMLVSSRGVPAATIHSFPSAYLEPHTALCFVPHADFHSSLVCFSTSEEINEDDSSSLVSIASGSSRENFLNAEAFSSGHAHDTLPVLKTRQSNGAVSVMQ